MDNSRQSDVLTNHQLLVLFNALVEVSVIDSKLRFILSLRNAELSFHFDSNVDLKYKKALVVDMLIRAFRFRLSSILHGNTLV